jgi:predicted secreted Zn-dependent protease
MPKIKCLVILAAALLAGCTSSAINQRTSVNVGFYDVRGTSFAELDKQIALHGPKVAGVGKAVAATAIRMIPDVRFKVTNNLCAVESAKVRVQAKVTLPRFSDRSRAKRELRGAFNNLETYTRLHEAVHVSIADQHAELAEKKILGLKPQDNCETLTKLAAREFQTIMARHEKAQLEFDANEQARLAKLDKRQ